MSGQTMEEKIEALLESFAAPVSAVEAADGWTVESKEAMRKLFLALKHQLKFGGPLPPLTISRALDHWGVVSGELLEKVAHISNELRSRS